MKDMKTLRYILMFVPVFLLASLAVSCVTENFKDPEPWHEWTQEEVVADGYEMMSIWDFKKNYYHVPLGEIDANGNVGTIVGNRIHGVTITDRVAIQGKVISTDRFGNLYRSLYIQDETGAIEIKVGRTGLYNDYKVGQRIFIKADGLILGNYRFMLSLGAQSTDASYSNGFIDLPLEIERTILPGRFEGMNAQDTIVVNASNVKTLLRDPQDLGRLVRFNDARSKWGTGQGSVGDDFSSTDRYPSFLQSITTGNTTEYISWIWDNDGVWRAYATGGTQLPNAVWPGASSGSLVPDYPTWAFRDWGVSFYGSALFVVGDDPAPEDPNPVYPRNFVVRTSGYALFALVELPHDGEAATLTAMYNKYCSSGGGFIKYQLLLNSSNDAADPVTGRPLYKFDR